MSAEAESFTSRRPAANALPAFSLPPPNIDAPSMARHSFYPSSAGNQSDSSHQNQNTILTSHNSVSTQPPTPSSVSAHADSYTHSRPPSTPSYYTASSTPQQSSFPSYPPQPSPTQHSPPGHGPVPRGMGSAGMAPPNSYRPYAPYQPLHNMGGSAIMSNIHQPGSQMSMIPGMGVPSYGPMIYGGHGPPPPQSERPFKCDQCTQSFSRNHDLKRHKRIHLAVKPFPCTFCSKSFSRKDALKRHRLVKGCENKANEANNGDSNGADRSGEENDSPEVKREQ
jgi:uncharacterized Zn-finger protein